MKRLLLPILLLFTISLSAQVGTYSFRAYSSSYTALTGATADNNIEVDDAMGAVISLGFSFNYDGTNYSHIIASSNGWISFDTTVTASTVTNDLDNSSTAIRPLLAPLWDDLSGANTSSEAGYTTTGTSPNRVFTYEWKNWLWNYTASTPVVSMQVQLYESSNRIEFRYKRESGAVVRPSASIGIAGANTGTNNFLSLDATSSNPIASSSFETTFLSTTPATGQVYEFSPPKNRDAGVSAKVGAVCAGSNPVIVALKNYGLDTLRSSSIAWSVATNGGGAVAQTNASWSGTLLRGDTVHVNLGSFNFQTGNNYNIVAYSFNPNNQTDENHANDTLLLLNYQTGMSGTYTIGGSAPDYSNFTNAVSDLEARGVCGAVTFDVRYAAYNEQISIGSISGVSASNTVTFRSAPGRVAQAELYFTPAANLYVLQFDGAAHIIFDDIFIESLNSGSGRVISFTGENESITLQNCRIKSPGSSTTSSNSAVIYDFSGVTNFSSNITIKNNSIEGGSYGIYFYGNNTTDFQDGLTIEDNDISGFYYMGIYTYANSNVKVANNTIEDGGSYTSPNGIRLNYSDSSEIAANSIVLNGTSSPIGLYVYFCDGSSSKPVKVYNNIVHLASQSATGSPTGIYGYQGENNQIYYNTSVLQSGGTASESLYLNYLATHSADIRNNSLVNYGTGYATYVANTAGIDTMDYNNLFSAGTNIAYWSGARTTLAALRAISSKAVNSINADPNYTSTSNLRTYSVDLDGKATPIANVSTDYDGDTRNTTTPDIGADEYTPPAIDISVKSIFTNDLSPCGEPSQSLRAIIGNDGTQAQHTIPVVLRISGAITQTLNATYTDTLASGARDTVTFSSFSTSIGGNFDFLVYSAMTGDTVGFNDTLETATIAINAIPAEPTSSNVVVCSGEDAQLVATGTQSIFDWYDSPTGGTLLTSNDTLNLTALAQTDTFYVDNYNMNQSNVGASDSTIGFGGSYLSYTQGMVFDVNNSLSIDSVTVYPFGNGSLKINLVNSAGSIIQSRTISIASAGSKRVYVGFNVSPGTDYELTATGSAIGGGLWRNSSGATYPYTDAGNNIRIHETNNSLGTSGYFYFFYNWVITVEGCHSDRKAVVATVNPVPTVDLGADTGFCQGQNFNITLDATNANSSYLWQNNSTSPSISVNSVGQYWVRVQNNFNCFASDTMNVTSNQKPQANNSVFPDYCESLAPFKLTQGGGSPAGGNGYYYGPGALGDSLFAPGAAGAGTHPLSYVYESGIGCSDTATAQVNILPKPTAIFGAISNLCANASPIPVTQASGTPAGGVGVYSGPGLSGGTFDPNSTGAGTFTFRYVYTAANTCVDTAFQTITVDTLPVVSPGIIPSVCANEDSVLLNQGTPAGGVYSGNGIQNNILNARLVSAGLLQLNYTYTDANNCVGSAQGSVRINPAPNLNLGPDTVLCQGETLFLNAGLSFTTYRWDDGSQSREKTITSAGVYVLSVTNSNGCEAVDSVTVEVETCTGISEDLSSMLKVYPNPSSELLHISIPKGMLLQELRLMDASGRLVLSEMRKEQSIELDMSAFAPGSYILELKGEGFELRERIVKK